MRITLFTAGSRGDIQPCVVLGQGLQRAGHVVRVAAPENFAGFVTAHGLAVHPLRGDVQQIMAGETGREFMERGGANPIRAMRTMRTLLEPVAMQMAEDGLAACQEADALISLAVFAPVGQTIAEIRQIPLILVEPTPLLPSRAFPAAGWPLQRNLGGLHNRLSGHLMLFAVWPWYGPFVNRFRRQFGLRPYTASSFHRILTATPLLGAYSPAVIPPPPDWPPTAHVTGYWFADGAEPWSPGPEFESFMAGGEPPVYVGYGSMAGRDAQQSTALVVEALTQAGRRGVLLTGWGGMAAAALPDPIFAWVIRAVNRKGVRAIHDEMRSFQATHEQSLESAFLRWFVLLPGFVRRLFLWFLAMNPQLIKEYSGTVLMIGFGMFGAGGGWGIPVPNHTLQVTLGSIAQKPGVVEGRIEVREFLAVTISLDHDIVDGAPAARFAQRLKEALERGYGLDEALEIQPQP